MRIKLIFLWRDHDDNLLSSARHTMILAKGCLLSAFSREFREILLKYCFALTQNSKLCLPIINGTSCNLFLACDSPHCPQKDKKKYRQTCGEYILADTLCVLSFRFTRHKPLV